MHRTLGSKPCAITQNVYRTIESSIHLAIGSRIDSGELIEVEVGRKHATPISTSVKQIKSIMANKSILIFGIEGAYRIGIDKRLKEYVHAIERICNSGVKEIWCIAIHNPYILGAWGLKALTDGKIRLMADRDGRWTKSIGFARSTSLMAGQIEADAYSLLVDNGIIKSACYGDFEFGLPAAKAGRLLEFDL